VWFVQNHCRDLRHGYDHLLRYVRAAQVVIASQPASFRRCYGSEFARHGWLREALDMTTYFCDAYASWQKGGIENANGRLRRWLPRQTNLDDISDEDMAEILMTYNLTPRKCLGYRTPFQALFSELGRDVRLRFA